MKGLATIIIPIYNQSNTVTRVIALLKKQTYGFKNIEIILVNDGSEDDSDRICKRLEKHYQNVRYYYIEHKGVSAARNVGIKEANGKYIFFLDADDRISRNTVKDCVRLFDAIYEQVDLLTYPIETYYKGRKLEPHFRYRYLTRDGIVDLNTEAFVGQTTMNIVVKNRFDYNILFDENMSFSEDQKYCCDVLHDKLKMGFCATGKYIYYRSEESTSGRLSGACYIFESSMKMFEDIFSRYEHVPMAFQGLFVNDVYWKMLENIFFPYHYNSADYNTAMARVKALLRRCYNYVILSHPNFDYYEKFYLMRLKGENSIQIELKKNEIALYSEGNDVFRRRDIEMVITKFHITGGKVRILGFLKSVFFLFYRGNIDLYAIENGSYKRLMELHPSVHNYYRSHEPTQRFYALDYECTIDEVQSLSFELHMSNTILPVGYYLMPLVPFSKTNHMYSKGEVQAYLDGRSWRFRFCECKVNKKIWLYYDCIGVEIDNALMQFQHDVMVQDGIDRYYVLTDQKQLKHIPHQGKTVRFGSEDHKRLFCEANRIITAFIESDNLIPYPVNEYSKIANNMHFDVIYLQHGVLHIDMPWKYSPEKILADKIVVSSDVDFTLFKKNGYQDQDLWKTGMPRFDRIEKQDKHEKKMLFAPSWRSYLVTMNQDRGWQVLEKKFYLSRYYYGIKDFLESEQLSRILQDYGYVLDVKLHPIFLNLNLNIQFDNRFIKIIDSVSVTDYELFVTDFSSYLFDFLYMDIAMLSYIPDYEEFACGMNGYRKVDFMDKVNDSDICKDENQIVNAIHSFLETGKGMDYKVRFYRSNEHAVDKIYHLMMDYESEE